MFRKVFECLQQDLGDGDLSGLLPFDQVTSVVIVDSKIRSGNGQVAFLNK